MSTGITDYTSTPLFNDRETYSVYWFDDDTLNDWADRQLTVLVRLADDVGGPSIHSHDQGLDWELARRMVEHAREHNLTVKAPDDTGAIDCVPITLDVIRPWIGTWLLPHPYGRPGGLVMRWAS